MKLFTGLLGILLLGAILAEETAEERSRLSSTEDRPCKRNTGGANFAGELYNNVRDTLSVSEDFVISPLGVSAVLGTLLFAVGPLSVIEINDLLYPKCGNLSRLARRPPILPLQKSTLKVPTVAMVGPTVYVDPEFVKQANKLGSYIYRTNFSTDMYDFNEFVQQKTNDRSIFAFEGLFRGQLPPSTRILFYNHVKFVAGFEQSFRIEKSLVRGIGQVMVAQRAQALYAYVPNLKARVLGLQLMNTESFLLILLPKRGVEISRVERNLLKVDVRRLPRKLTPTLVDITLPKIFEYKYTYLRKAMQKAGIETVFNKSVSDLKAFRNEALDNVLLSSGFSLSPDGINWSSDYKKPKDYIIEAADYGEVLEFNALEPLIYAVVDSRHVYLMGRTLREKRP